MTIQQYGDGSTSRDYTFIDDIADGVVRAIDTPLGYEVLNLGNGRPYQLKDFIRLVESSVGREAKIEVVPDQPGDVDRTCADISKARALIGYNPQVPFEEGIARTVQWYQAACRAGLFEECAAMSPHPLNRSVSDLELSSYVEKAPKQMKQRKDRVFKSGRMATIGLSSSSSSANFSPHLRRLTRSTSKNTLGN